MLKNYLKTALRNLWRNKTYSFLNVLGLSVGIACAGLIFLWVEDELTYDHHNTRRNQLYRVMNNQTYEGKTSTFAATPGILAQGMRDEMPEVANTCRLSGQQFTLFALGDKAIYERGYYADSSLFSMFTVPFTLGKKERAFDQLHTLVISEKMAKTFFGDERNAIGKTLKIDNKAEYVITGVVKDLPENSSVKFDWVAPFKNYEDQNAWLQEWGNNGIQTFVELKPTANVDAFNQKFQGYLQSKDSSVTGRPFLFSMNHWRLRSKFENGKQAGGRIQYVKLFSTIAWIILLIACINFMNLATARSEKRAREVGVRKVLGAAKRMLILQFTGEALLMSLIAVLIAVGIIYFVLQGFNSLVDKKLHLALDNPVHSVALLVIALLCGLVAGSYPSVYLSSFSPTSVLKGLMSKGSAAAVIRKVLVVVQFSISIILIICTIIIYQQVQHIKGRELGYNKANLIQTGLRGDMQKNFSVIKHDLLATGAVENAALSNLNMLYMGSQTDAFSWDGKEPSSKYLITQDWISPEYISTMGLKLIEGRDFYPDAKQDSSSVIINETLAKTIGKKNIVGSILTQDSIKYTIAGVVKDFVFGDMYGKSNPVVFLCYPEYFGYMYVRLKPKQSTEQTLSKIESIIKRNNPAYPFDYIFVDDEFDKIFKSENMIGKLSRIFAFLSIFISCLGLFGLAAYTAERRTKEIGIRKVLGASVSRITTLLTKDFLRLVLVSFVIAFPLAWWAMNNWLQDFAYRINIHWMVFVIAGVCALLIALLTISFQAIKAAVANPVKNLRTE
ncbi:MAG: ABC transporter permease [Chitinophagaceae bacterium]